MAKKFEPGTYRVVNKERRARVRDGVRIPGAKDGQSTSEVVEVQVNDRAQLHRLRTTKSLEVTGPVKATTSGRGAGTSGGQ